ncbi:isoprenylcysteine carboxylmethyltransferase family protein [Candidatus Bathyarchaeota archaeon]|nr:isoprenylcysteine carboxylmethyltransferase family protein [Candidatus Bathyarchaeota archaeon]MBT4319418.1 isoprenylcysteine carboxylmethyltransferase family protein [Candidatus Bathyarchaeota archaeon]MBT4422944.1 isoprenylcysteine carboxylmethyltransferase family protein [Candidatus Bathyarchaeota archaeon]MBT6604498.1 isoprenylcysteine carboxylmethyltransferase family protein [Candidatus Bathyarchaeota archaeon]MBT7187275.1 isoprenylcysteine carboxylmethyltransferase family protein [Cand
MKSNLKANLSEDLFLIPYLVTVFFIFTASIYEYVIFRGMSLRFDAFFFSGFILVLAGSVLRYLSRRALVNAGMRTRDTPFLQKGHELVTAGVYGVIRHPLYLGEMLRNIGVPLLLKSMYGGFLVPVGIILLFYRIEAEEKHLIRSYGQEYMKYMEGTWKLVPGFI